MVILGRPQLFFFFGFAIKKYINVLQQVSGRAPLARDASGNPF